MACIISDLETPQFGCCVAGCIPNDLSSGITEWRPTFIATSGFDQNLPNEFDQNFIRSEGVRAGFTTNPSNPTRPSATWRIRLAMPYEWPPPFRFANGVFVHISLGTETSSLFGNPTNSYQHQLGMTAPPPPNASEVVWRDVPWCRRFYARVQIANFRREGEFGEGLITVPGFPVICERLE